jgi:hypothetical protein
VVVDEYIAVLLSMSAGGRHGVFGWMRTIVDLEFGDVTPHVPLVEDKVGSVSCVRMSYYRRWAVRTLVTSPEILACFTMARLR